MHPTTGVASRQSWSCDREPVGVVGGWGGGDAAADIKPQVDSRRVAELGAPGAPLANAPPPAAEIEGARFGS